MATKKIAKKVPKKAAQKAAKPAAKPAPVIVVGVDGSVYSERALDWALDEAKARRGKLVVLHSYEYGIVAANPYAGEALTQLEHDAEELLERAIVRASASGIEVDGRIAYGSASHALVEASAGADLLVVGSRGRGGLAGALLGSVSQACVHHAACPVVVVPPSDRVVKLRKNGTAAVA